MFSDLKLKGGDISFDELGRLEFVEGKESLSQSIMNRLNTIRGDLFYNLKYGMNIDFSRIKRLDRYKSQIEFYIKDALKDDLRLDGVAVVDLIKTGKDQFTAKLRIYLTNKTILDLNFIF